MDYRSSNMEKKLTSLKYAFIRITIVFIVKILEGLLRRYEWSLQK